MEDKLHAIYWHLDEDQRNKMLLYFEDPKKFDDILLGNNKITVSINGKSSGLFVGFSGNRHLVYKDNKGHLYVKPKYIKEYLGIV